MSERRILSLFSGLGGLDLGFRDEGFHVVKACDNDPNAVATYNAYFGASANLVDIGEHDPYEFPDADVVIGGPPCQPFSLVGRRRQDDPRGSLVAAFAAVVAAKRPTAFVMENVPGIESSKHAGEKIVDDVCTQLTRLGYHVTACKLLASDYLVPQRRRRVVLLGIRNGEIIPPDPDWFVRSRFGIERTQWDVGARAAIGDLGTPVGRGALTRYRAVRPSRFARLMRAPDLLEVAHHDQPQMSETDRRLVAVIPPGGNYQDVPDGVATPRILRFKQTGGRTTTYGRLHPDRPAYTINTYFRRPNVGCHFHYAEERLITAREAMRFQALPDSMRVQFTRIDERNALIGNAVPSLLARAIASAVEAALSSSARSRRLRAAV